MRLIDADALKKQFEDRSLEDFTHLHFIDAINDAPTVSTYTFKEVNEIRQAAIEQTRIRYNKRELLRPHGEWIKGREISRTMLGINVQHIEYEDYTCSNCGLVLDNLLYRYDGSLFYKFCPNCGADMRKEEQHDTP